MALAGRLEVLSRLQHTPQTLNPRHPAGWAQLSLVLRQITDLKVSEIVKRAIDTYYDRITGSRSNPAEILTTSGFVGIAKADPDLSETYKDRITESLAAKHDHR